MWQDYASATSHCTNEQFRVMLRAGAKQQSSIARRLATAAGNELRGGFKRKGSSRKLIVVCTFLGAFLLFVSQNYAQAQRQRATGPSSAADDGADGGNGGAKTREIELRQPAKQQPAAAHASSLSSYLSSARNLISSASEAHKKAKTYSSLLSSESPKAQQMLSDSIGKTTSLIESYRHEGLANMPALPNLPGLGSVARLPDKLLRAELSMLQDLIRMAEETRERPIMATVNAPRELASMLTRMYAQFNQ